MEILLTLKLKVMQTRDPLTCPILMSPSVVQMASLVLQPSHPMKIEKEFVKTRETRLAV